MSLDNKIVYGVESEFDAFDFELSEQLLVDRELAHWGSTQKELDDLWRKRLKDAILNLKLTDKEPVKIQELLVKRFKNRLTGVQGRSRLRCRVCRVRFA